MTLAKPIPKASAIEPSKIRVRSDFCRSFVELFQILQDKIALEMKKPWLLQIGSGLMESNHLKILRTKGQHETDFKTEYSNIIWFFFIVIFSPVLRTKLHDGNGKKE